MTAEISSSLRRKPKGLLALLSAATCEWFLMFLLFVDATFWYVAMRFAKFCELQTPCMLCSRLGNKKNGCYWNLLCGEHREELSSLVYCSVHEKFADANGMCEQCFTPLALQSDSNPETYKLLLGKSWVDVDRTFVQNLLVNKSLKLCSSSSGGTCSCCSRIFRTRSNSDRLFELVTIEVGASKVNVKPPLPRAPGRSRFGRRVGLKRMSADGLSHVGYSKLKISSDTESDFLYSEDDDDGLSSDFRCKNCGKIEDQAQPDAGRGSDKPPLIVDQPNLVDLSEPKNDTSLSDGFMEQLLVDLNWDEPLCKPGGSSSVAAGLLSLIDGTKQQTEVAEKSCGDTCVPQVHAISILSEFLSLCNSPKKNVGVEKHELLNSQMPPASPKSDPFLDGLTVSSVEGESIIDRLKRQIEQDQISMNLLYKELEEERNASADAANASMAKMTQLEEEKAGLKMEALQYLRMMEEQAEYDMEALERANDHIAEKDKEIQDLECELDFIRNNFLDDSGIFTSQNPTQKPEFEVEKESISIGLKNLEKKIDECEEGETGSAEIVGLFERQIAEIRDQIEAIESDRSFLIHTCELLQNGSEGLELVEEIARHLQELRKMEIKNR